MDYKNLGDVACKISDTVEQALPERSYTMEVEVMCYALCAMMERSALMYNADVNGGNVLGYFEHISEYTEKRLLEIINTTRELLRRQV